MAARTPCPDRVDLERLVLGLTRGPEANALEAHFAECPECLAVVRGLSGDDDLIAALRSDEPPLPTAPVAPVLLEKLFHLPAGGLLVPPGRQAVILDPPREPGELGRLGPYSIRQLLGEGGMGVVFLAWHTGLKRFEAVKMLREGALQNRERLSRFQREAELLARLRHPGIVQIHDIGLHAGTPYLAMEYVEGGSLAQRLATGPLPPADAAALLEILARAIHAAHAAGIIHRDLKPANVLLGGEPGASATGGLQPTATGALQPTATGGLQPTATGALLPPLADAPGLPGIGARVKITDFGLAKHLDEADHATLTGYDTRSGAILGTPNYMAPEQAASETDATPAVDVYSLGAILYECLTGRPPFQTATLLETLEQVRTREPIPPRRLQPAVPRDLETICLHCLHKSPARRYSSAQDLADDLARFREGKPIRARRVSWWTRLLKWTRRRPAMTGLILVSVFLLVGLIGGAVVYERRLQSALEQARTNGVHANANYRSAREAMNQMLLRAEDRRRADLPRLQELRREQQEDAEAFYLAVAAQPGNDPEVRLDAAYACLEAARLQIRLDRREAAGETLQRAHHLFTNLSTEFPKEGRYRQGLAQTCSALWAREPGAGLEWQEKALTLRQALVQEDPSSSEYRADLAESFHNLGHAHWNLKHPTEAERYWLQAIPLKEELVRQEPDSRKHRQALAVTQLNLSVLFMQQASRRADAGRFHDQAESNLVRLLDQDPRDFEVLSSLAVARFTWAEVLAGEKQGKRALEQLGRNIKSLTEASRHEPADTRIRDALFRSHGVRAQIQERLGRWVDAAVDWKRVVELSDEKGARYQRLYLAMALARAGEHELAMAEVEALAVMPDHAVMAHQIHLAQVAGWSARAARDDNNLPPDERAAQTERALDRSLQLLTKARAAGGTIGWATTGPKFRTDEAFRLLWDRADYQALFAK